VGLAHALIKQKYGGRDFNQSGWEAFHPTAMIHETANIGSDTVIEPRVVIGKNVKIGPRSRIMAGTVIENNAIIGHDTIIHPLAVIGYECQIGNHVVIGSGTIIGSEGYGFAQDAQHKSHSIPQTGIVIIEDRVRLGANNCIDRATYQETRIGAGTKLDNLCHVAHNVKIGQDCLLTAMLCVAGSTTIGDRVMTSGQTGILDHVNICDDTVLLHRAGVTKDIQKPGAYAGFPVQPLVEYMKNTAIMRMATDLRQRISKIEKKLQE
jgi:UDP-3-O-[3-hydroxymyristoyl] glucosamine N-acyltransferase